jgi:hypothetical protein
LSAKHNFEAFDPLVAVVISLYVGLFIGYNRLENFWSLIKRQWVGTHHHYSGNAKASGTKNL